MHLGYLAIAPLEYYRLATNASIDVKIDRLVHSCICALGTIAIAIIEAIVFDSSRLNHVQVSRLLLFGAEVLDFGRQACHIVELELPL